jgi:hypothetical protein
MEGARQRVHVAPSQGVYGLVRGLPRARLLRPHRAVHPRSSLRVRALAAASQPE